MCSIKTLLLVFLLSIASVQIYAQTQESSIAARAEAIEKAKENELTSAEKNIFAAVERVGKYKKKLEELDESFQTASGEAKESLILQRLDTYDKLVAELRELTALAVTYREGGGEPQVLLAEFRSNLLNAGRKLRASLDEHLQEYAANNTDRDTATPEGLKSYTFDTRLIDMGFSLLEEYVKVVEGVGYNAKPSRNYLQQEIPKRADLLVGQIRLNAEREQEYAALLKINKDDAEVLNKQRLLSDKSNTDTESLQLLIGVGEDVGLDVASYRQLLVKTTGSISADLMDINVLSGLFHEWWLSAKHSMRENLVDFIIRVVVFIAIIMFFRIMATFIKRLLLRSMKSASVKLSLLMQEMMTSMVSRIVMLLGLLVALAQVGVSLGPVLAGLGVVGFVIGFALQDTLGNFAAGVMILIYRPYDTDDFVEAAGVFGKVKSMNIVSTTILTIDNQTLIIPNSKIWGDVIKNVTAQKVRRVDMTFGVSYGDDIPHTEAVLHDIVTSHEKVLKSPEPMIKLHNLGDSSVDFVVRPWAKTEDYWDVYWDITREVKMRFDAEGISIPFPQRDVHFYREEGAATLPPEAKPSAT